MWFEYSKTEVKSYMRKDFLNKKIGFTIALNHLIKDLYSKKFFKFRFDLNSPNSENFCRKFRMGFQICKFVIDWGINYLL